MLDIIEIIKVVWIYFPFLIALVLIIDYELNNEYDIELELKDVKVRNEKVFRKLWEFVTGEKLNE